MESHVCVSAGWVYIRNDRVHWLPWSPISVFLQGGYTLGMTESKEFHGVLCLCFYRVVTIEMSWSFEWTLISVSLFFRSFCLCIYLLSSQPLALKKVSLASPQVLPILSMWESYMGGCLTQLSLVGQGFLTNSIDVGLLFFLGEKAVWCALGCVEQPLLSSP